MSTDPVRLSLLAPPAQKFPALGDSLDAALGLCDGQSPFLWQRRLHALCLRGELPTALDLATGLGKTSTMAIWLHARLHGANLPRRLVYVVDRRAVVDQATEEAVRLKAWAESLGHALPVSTLRGQHVDNKAWLENPAGLAIIVGTVDLVGSQLLFQGYTTSPKMRPYHAGLLGNDTLFVLDEAHLAPAFQDLLERIVGPGESLRPDLSGALATPSPPRLLALSATGRSGGAPFRLEAKEAAERAVAQRVHAEKWLSWEDAEVDPKDVSRRLADHAWELVGHGSRPLRCVVFANRRDAIVETYGHLQKRSKADAAGVELALLVGERRVHERAGVMDTLKRLGFVAGSPFVEKPAILLATSAGEVGVDLDADCAVMDLVAWERMAQRLGRVNRRGGTGRKAEVRVLIEALSDKADDEERQRRVMLRALLERLPSTVAGFSASPAALGQLRDTFPGDVEAASTPAPLHPRLERATLDDWSMTSLPPHPGRPRVTPWLRGWVRETPQTTLVWRRHLPVRGFDEFFDAAPIHASERLEVEAQHAAAWLSKRLKVLHKRAEKTRAEAERVSGEGGEPGKVTEAPRTALRSTWSGGWGAFELAPDRKVADLADDLEGAMIVLPAELGGLSEGMLDDAEDTAPPTADTEGALEGIHWRVRFERRGSELSEAGPWRRVERSVITADEEGDASWLVIERRKLEPTSEESRSIGRAQGLDEHQAWAETEASLLAKSLGLGDRAATVLTLAARLHDEGKAAERWQRAFGVTPEDRPLAKSGRGGVNQALLGGYRHEFGSLPKVEADPRFTALDAGERDLVLHLVASHHGHARPTIPTVGCEDAPPSKLTERAQQVALRYARLQQHWGPWGLAWWEALLRAADQRASRRNDEVRDDTKGGD